MNKSLLVGLGSYRAIVALLEKMETSEISGLAEARAAFITEVDDVAALAQRQAQRVRPVFEERDATFGRMAIELFRLGGQAWSFAERTERSELASKLRLMPSVYSTVSFERRVIMAQDVHDTMREALPSLAPAGITAETLAGLQQTIAAARSALAGPRSAVVQRAGATLLLKAKHRRLRRMVRMQLDPLFRPLRWTNPGLYHEYTLARKRLDRSAARSGAEPAAGATIALPQPLEVKVAA